MTVPVRKGSGGRHRQWRRAAFWVAPLAMVWLGCSEILPQRTQGERLYRRWCAGCHGVDGAGNTPRYMAIPQANLLNDHWAHGGSEGAIKAVIREGVLGRMPANDHLSAEQVDAIYEHLMVLRARARDQSGWDG